MKQHTIQLEEEIKKLGRQIDSEITYGNTILKEELYKVTPLFNGNILKSVMKQLEVETTVDIPIGTVINYKLGIKVGDDYEYLDYGNYIVNKSEELKDSNRYKLTCYDKMLYAMKRNESLGIQYPITIKNYLIALATKIGLTVKNTSFNNQSVQIPEERYEGLEYTYRDILDEIAQATGSIIVINADDEIEVKYPETTGVTIDEEMLKDINVTFGQKYGPINAVVLTRSGGSDSIYIRDEESVAQNGLCEIKIENNQLMNFNDRDQYLQGILAGVDGLYYYINDFSSTGICFLETGDLYNIGIGEESYQCIMLNDEIDVEGGIQEYIHTELPEESVTDYSKADKTDRRINETYLIVDKQNQQIDAVISNVEDQDEKIAQISLTVGELESKISEISDITVSGESSYASVTLTNVNESEPIRVEIRPIGTNISYLYPRDNLYPSDTLYMPDRILNFHNNTTNEDFPYTLPGDLLYYDSEHYDEFILDYVDGINGVCQIIKRVGYNADGTTYILSTPQTINYTPYPTIHLTGGDYTVSLPGYSQGYLFVRLMASNIYTSEFATRIEMNSAISQTASNINLSVDQKLLNYSTTSEMNAAIDIKANQITSTVSQTYSTKAETTTAKNAAIAQANSDTDDKLEDYSTTVEMNSAITQKADEISLVVNQKVNSSDYTHAKIVAKINDSTSSVLISADKINLTGYLTISGASGTYATKSGLSSGTTTVSGGCITTGTIQAVTLQSTNYEAGSTGTKIQLSNGVIDSKNFKINSSGNVTVNGTITSSNVTLTGGTIKSGNYVSGTSGTLINLSNGSIDSKNFKVSSTGALTASNATITGNITATSGTIGGCSIRNGTLYVDNANINSINGSKIVNESLTGNKIANYSIESSKIVSLSADKIVTGTLNAIRMYGCTFESGYVYADEIISTGIVASRGSHYGIIDADGGGHDGITIDQTIMIAGVACKVIGGIIVRA